MYVNAVFKSDIWALLVWPRSALPWLWLCTRIDWPNSFEWNDYAVVNGWRAHNVRITNAAALARIETKARITAADVTGTSNVREQDAAAEKLLSRLEGTRND